MDQYLKIYPLYTLFSTFHINNQCFHRQHLMEYKEVAYLIMNNFINLFHGVSLRTKNTIAYWGVLKLQIDKSV